MKDDREYVLNERRKSTKLDVTNREQYQRTELKENMVEKSDEDTKQEPPL